MCAADRGPGGHGSPGIDGGLRWSDVDLHEGVLTVRQALQRVGGELLIVAPKTQRSARRVALPAECVTALRAQRAQQTAATNRAPMPA